MITLYVSLFSILYGSNTEVCEKTQKRTSSKPRETRETPSIRCFAVRPRCGQLASKVASEQAAPLAAAVAAERTLNVSNLKSIGSGGTVRRTVLRWVAPGREEAIKRQLGANPRVDAASPALQGIARLPRSPPGHLLLLRLRVRATARPRLWANVVSFD